MHYSKRFIAFGGIVAIAFLIKYNIPGAESVSYTHLTLPTIATV